MATRNVVLTQHQDDLIEALVKKGRYQNASEVLRDGLRLVELRDAEHAAKLQWLRGEIQIGEDAFEHGDFMEFPDAKSLRDYLEELTKEIIGDEDGR